MRRAFILMTILAALFLEASGQSGSGYVPKNGFVPDSKTAIAVAEAVLRPIYGNDKVEAERPFSARLEQGVWHVERHFPDGDVGGVAMVQIRKSDAAIIFVLHGK